MGIIALKGVEVFARIGVLPEERLVGRKFLIDIEIESSLKKVSQSDNIEDVFSYEIISRAIYHNLQTEFKLMEAACRAIAKEIIEKAPDIRSMKVRMHKLSPLMKGNIEASMIEWHYPEDW
jgi:7,8-dihydroneopterin aldolase/epimerase/oxygenase